MMHTATCRSWWTRRESACDCQIKSSPVNGQSHCQQCGSTDYENVVLGARENDGYSACCNEIVMVWCDEQHCHHLKP